MEFTRPIRGFIFWPVGNGDSTTVCIEKETFMQIDLNHKARAEVDNDPNVAVIEELKELLPKRDGRPYLSVFVLTHPDQDHCRGFEELLECVTIGELWFTPRIFNEYTKELSDDAAAFKREAVRRVEATVAKNGAIVGPGDRILVVGYDDLLKKKPYKGLPNSCIAVPGTIVTKVDGTEQAAVFRTFIHSPFKDDIDGERNDTSLGMQVTLTRNGGKGRALLFGDLAYPTMMRIFDRSDNEDLTWDLFQAPHHCSKSVMYQKNENGELKLQQDILGAIDAASNGEVYIVSSSEAIPSSNQSGDNPPHARAKNRYVELLSDATRFKCTGEHVSSENPKPIVFEVDEAGLSYVGPEGTSKSAMSKSLRELLNDVEDDGRPPTQVTGFGRDK